MSKFLIGSSTAAHQVEGGNIHSDYWAMENMKYTSFVEKSGDAIDHYHHYKEDIEMMAKAGLNAYRFSIEWARIEPEEGKFDEKEIQHYHDVLACCKENNIEPILTLMHFTSPKWLIEKGGWESEEVVNYFANYAKKIALEYGNEIHYICTINEANMGIQVAAIAERYKRIFMAKLNPINKIKGLFKKKEKKEETLEGKAQVGMNFNQMMKNMKLQSQENVEVFGTTKPQVFVSARTPNGDHLVCLAHQKAKEAIKAINPSIQVGITLSLHDIQAQKGGEANAKKEWEEEFEHYLPYIKDDDFFGLQNYTRTLVGKNGDLPTPTDAKLTQMEYEYYPEALEHVIRKVAKEISIPIMVTENGIATTNDEERISFIKTALEGVKACKKDGIPLLGYMHWSFADNFEWQKGFSMQFGLVAVDRGSMKRTPKPSLAFLGSYINQF